VCFPSILACLHNEKDKEMVLEGASRLQRGATADHEVARQSNMPRARIQEDDKEDEELFV
jgi:hypothetical protein